MSVELFIEALVPGPWSIAMLAIQLSGILECEEAEQVLAIKSDTRLCVNVGSYCSSRIPLIGVCLEKTESHCCFNSRLARIINEQGRAQIGRGWGAAESPDCGGFTVAQLQGLDFSRMNLAEFYAEIAPTLPDVGAMSARAQQKVESYYKP
jgi:conjugal transfer mating pair stabilization protein TraN